MTKIKVQKSKSNFSNNNNNNNKKFIQIKERFRETEKNNRIYLMEFENRDGIHIT